MKFKYLTIDVRPSTDASSPLPFRDEDMKVLQFALKVDGTVYHYHQLVQDDFFMSEFDHILDMIKHEVQKARNAELSQSLEDEPVFGRVKTNGR